MIAKTFSSGNVTVNIHDVCFSDRTAAEKCAGRLCPTTTSAV